MHDAGRLRLTERSPGGGCSCKVSPAQLEAWLESAYGASGPPRTDLGELVCGIESGDDATVVALAGGPALVTTTDFFPPVVDDPYDWGRIAATNAISDVYAMGGEPVSGLNLLALPAELPDEVAVEVLRGGRAVADEAPFVLAGGHSIVAGIPLYGLAVTGVADPARLLRNDTARAGLPITLTKPLGVGVLNNWHKATGSPIPEAVDCMTRSNRDAARAALAAGIVAATDVTGFGLLGHLFKMARASGVAAVVEARAVPYLERARGLLAKGYVPGGSRRNLDWVRPSMSAGPGVGEDELLLLADAQTSGGLLLAGELPASAGGVVIGELVPLPPGGGGPLLLVR